MKWNRYRHSGFQFELFFEFLLNLVSKVDRYNRAMGRLSYNANEISKPVRVIYSQKVSSFVKQLTTRDKFDYYLRVIIPRQDPDRISRYRSARLTRVKLSPCLSKGYLALF